MTGHLIHIGYPKCGSTTLRRWFADHPQLAYADVGFGGFRDLYEVQRAAFEKQRDIRCRVTSSEGLSIPLPTAGAGRSAIDYRELRDVAFGTAQEAVCMMLADLFPDAYVLIVTRGFRSLILSSYSQYARSAGEADIADFVALEQPVEMDPWNYDRLIAAYTRAFGAGRVLVLPWELLRDDGARFIRAIEEPLGLDHHPLFRERLNPSLSPAEMYWYPRFTRFVRRLRSRRILRVYLAAMSQNRLRLAIRVLQRVRPAPPVSADAIPNHVVERYRGCAESLRDNPCYAPYAGDYLL